MKPFGMTPYRLFDPLQQHSMANLRDGNAIRNPDGSQSTTRSMSVQDPRLNNGATTLIPTVYEGREVPYEEAIARAAGGQWPSFDGAQSEDEATRYSQDASAMMQSLPDVAREMEADQVWNNQNREYENRGVTWAERNIIEAGETIRAAIAGQEAGAAHSVFAGGRPIDQNSFRVPMDRKLSRSELLNVREIFDKHGLPDTVDTGSGVTGTRFYPKPAQMSGQQARDLTKELHGALPGSGTAFRGNVDSAYIDLVEKWKAGEGSGQVSQAIIDSVNATPELRRAFDNNPDIAVPALNYIARDADLAEQYGTTFRKDLKTLREIVASGRGWVGRLEEAIKKGGIVPAIGIAFLGAAYVNGGESEL